MTVEKDNFRPVNRLPNDPENGHLSKAQAQEKWRHQKAVDAKMKTYEAKARAEVEAEEKKVAEKVDAQVEADAPKTDKVKVKK